jgi:hypothetical protein
MAEGFHNKTPHFTGFFAQAGDWFALAATSEAACSEEVVGENAKQS